MRRVLIDGGWLVDWSSGRSFAVEAFEELDGQVIEGVLRSPSGAWYPIEAGVPNLLRTGPRGPREAFARRHDLPLVPGRQAESADKLQAKTAETFSDKWRRFRNYGMEKSHRDFLFGWYCQKLDLADLPALEAFYAGMNSILEVGPGSGFNSRFMAEHCRGDVIAVDISEGALTTYENTSDLPNCHVIQADLMDLPLPDGAFDFVIADGVLHHTPDTRKAVDTLYRKVRPGGRFFFYVYREMGPAREFSDEFIRAAFSRMEPEECYEACEAITGLGRALSRLQATITLDKPIPILGIPAGTHDVQRLFYYNFLKCFWNDVFDFETNNMVNFDWYHPLHAWHHTEDEVRAWLESLRVETFQFNAANPNGISVLLTKPL